MLLSLRKNGLTSLFQEVRVFKVLKTQELSGDPNPQYFLKSTAVQMGGVLPYKWEAYCSTNGRCIVDFPFFKAWKPGMSRIQLGGAYCRTN